MFNTLAQGVISASAETHDRIRSILSGLDEVVQIKDDVILCGEGEAHYRSLETHDRIRRIPYQVERVNEDQVKFLGVRKGQKEA